jgi:hypothetical protein
MPSINQIQAAMKMKAEITTLEQFQAIGGYNEVAAKYGVGVSTAHGLLQSLRLIAKEKGDNSYKNDRVDAMQRAEKMRQELPTIEEFHEVGSFWAVAKKYGVSKTTANKWEVDLRKKAEKMETIPVEPTPSEATNIPKDENTLPQAQEGVVGTSKADLGSNTPEGVKQIPESVINETEESDRFCVNCGGVMPEKWRGRTKSGIATELCRQCFIDSGFIVPEGVESIDDLQGLVEPEPPWDGPIWKECGKFTETEEPLSDEQIWDGIRGGLKEWRERRIKSVDAEIREKLAGLMGGSDGNLL